MRLTVVLLPAGAVPFAGCGGPARIPFKPVADTKLLMQSVIDPSADLVWTR